MRSLIKTLGVGAILFVVICIAQDWRNFFRLTPGPGQRTADPAARAAAEQTIHKFISLARHAYRSGGEPGFLERLPASDAVIRELSDELDYLRLYGRVQDPELIGLEFLDSEQIAPDRMIIRTREDWIARATSTIDGSRLDDPRRHLVFVEYRLQHEGPGWQVVGWDFTAPPTEPQDGPPPTP